MGVVVRPHVSIYWQAFIQKMHSSSNNTANNTANHTQTHDDEQFEVNILWWMMTMLSRATSSSTSSACFIVVYTRRSPTGERMCKYFIDDKVTVRNDSHANSVQLHTLPGSQRVTRKTQIPQNIYTIYTLSDEHRTSLTYMCAVYIQRKITHKTERSKMQLSSGQMTHK